MTDYVFFAPDGELLDKEQFIKLYGLIYRYSVPDWKLENDVENILRKGTLSHEDIIKIFEWKTGCRSTDGKTVHYRSVVINADDVARCINPKAEMPEQLLDDLLKIKGLGSVYAITVLYFLSGGKYPIYDRFAHTGADAILNQNHTEFGKRIVYKGISNSKSGKTVFQSYKEKYADKFAEIKKIFGENVSDRDIDRALWAYGHLFYAESKKEKP